MSDGSLTDRVAGAVFSGVAAAATYAFVLVLHAGSWGTEQRELFLDLGIWLVLAGAALGFVGGLSLVARFWGGIWDTTHESLISLRTALVLLVLVAIAYGVYQHLL